MAFVDNPFLLLLLLSLSPISIDSRIGNSSDVPLENVVIPLENVVIPLENVVLPHWDQKSFDKYFERIEINRKCDINENCTHSMLCIDNLCRCRPNHKWSRLEKNCISFDCKTNETECQSYDPHRECRHISLSISSLFGGQCECTHGYYEDKRNMKCRKLCHNNAECDSGIARGGVTNNLVCVDALCQCRPNFKWDVVSNRCQAFNCTKDAECWTGDENRECVDGQCVCNFQEDRDSTKCYLSLYSLFRFRNYKTRKERLLLLSLFIMPSVTLYCLYSQLKKRKSQKLIAKTLDNKPPINYIYLTKTQEMRTSKV